MMTVMQCLAVPVIVLSSLALQLAFPKISESMGNHDSKIVDAGSVD
jgi:outer membrane lipoprotein-sorting protein